jgi:hypothetical protein
MQKFKQFDAAPAPAIKMMRHLVAPVSSSASLDHKYHPDFRIIYPNFLNLFSDMFFLPVQPVRKQTFFEICAFLGKNSNYF